MHMLQSIVILTQDSLKIMLNQKENILRQREREREIQQSVLSDHLSGTVSVCKFIASLLP